MTAPTLDLDADKRAPFIHTIGVLGVDLSDAVFLMQVRQHPGDTGPALLTATVTATYEAEFKYVDARGREHTGPATAIVLFVAEADLEGLPFAASHLRNLDLVYDLHVTPDGGIKQVLVQGKFTVSPGVTI